MIAIKNGQTFQEYKIGSLCEGCKYSQLREEVLEPYTSNARRMYSIYCKKVGLEVLGLIKQCSDYS